MNGGVERKRESSGGGIENKKEKRKIVESVCTSVCLFVSASVRMCLRVYVSVGIIVDICACVHEWRAPAYLRKCLFNCIYARGCERARLFFSSFFACL